MNKLIVFMLSMIAIALGLIFLIPDGYLAGLLPSEVPEGGDLGLSLPEDTSIEIFAEVPGARSLAYLDGVVFVGSRSAGKVYAIDEGEVILIAENLNSPNGVALKDADLYVAEIGRILRFPDIMENLDDPSFEIVTDKYPNDPHHGWKFIAFGPDGLLYVPVGAPCNLCDDGDPYATITKLDVDSGEFEIIARGVRNTVGFDWHPDTGELWFTDNGRDWYGDDQPPDELNHLSEEGMHFGYPYCHGKDIPDDEFTSRSCDEFAPAELELGPHVAALGMRFYEGDMFAEYRDGVFIAEHGSWNRELPIGYRVMYVPFEDGSPAGYEVFAEGWLEGEKAWGRPVDVLVMPDGSLLVSDDKAGKVYRIFR